MTPTMEYATHRKCARLKVVPENKKGQSIRSALLLTKYKASMSKACSLFIG
jgi:hypothetical protein